MSPQTEPQREDLEANANALRSRLARTLESLDRRRHDLFNVKVQASRHPWLTFAVGATALGALASTIGVSYLLHRHHKRQLPMERLRALGRIWHHPKRVARFSKGTIAGDIARSVLVSAVSFGISELLQRALKQLLPPIPQQQPVPVPVSNTR
jgi:hypothetical protein